MKEVIKVLREKFPSGHPEFIDLTIEELDLHNRKNNDYASGGNPLGNFYRVGKILELYPNLKLSDPRVVALVYMLKQVDATLWMLSNGHESKVETVDKRLEDVHVYAKIIRLLDREIRKNEKRTI